MVRANTEGKRLERGLLQKEIEEACGVEEQWDGNTGMESGNGKKEAPTAVAADCMAESKAKGMEWVTRMHF